MDKNSIITCNLSSNNELQQFTPESALAFLKKGNQRFAQSTTTSRSNSDRITTARNGQYPLAIVSSCIDSRVLVEDIFQCGVGDLFVTRVAGSVVNKDILASFEYACGVCGAKLVIVMGHSYCGAIQSAIDEVKLGNITNLLSKIKPAIDEANKDFDGERSSKNQLFANTVSQFNVRKSIKDIRQNSPILKELEEKGEIKIVGGFYDLETGIVDFMME